MATEKRLIDANLLVDKLYDNEFAMLCPLDEVCGVIDDCPTVDAVEVVHCKNCKWYSKPTESELAYCKHPSGAVGDGIGGNFYCAGGERRADG